VIQPQNRALRVTLSTVCQGAAYRGSESVCKVEVVSRVTTSLVTTSLSPAKSMTTILQTDGANTQRENDLSRPHR
jgi:hypothetical protein